MNKRDEQLYKKIKLLVEELELSYYHRLLLSHMIYRKIKNPLEKTDEIMKKVTEKIVPEEYKKHEGRARMQLSVEKELTFLEEALHECGKLPENVERGMIVSGTIKYVIARVMDS